MHETSPENVEPGLAMPPENVRRLMGNWHKGECWVAVIAFGFIAGILVLRDRVPLERRSIEHAFLAKLKIS